MSVLGPDSHGTMTWGVDEHISVAEVLQYVINLPPTPLSYPTEKKRGIFVEQMSMIPFYPCV